METLPSIFSARSPRNAPHALLARLYREIGLSAVAAALQVPGPSPALSAEAAGLLAAAPGKAA